MTLAWPRQSSVWKRHRHSSRAFFAALCILSALAVYSHVFSVRHVPRVHARHVDGLASDQGDRCHLVHQAVDQCAFVTENCFDDQDLAFAAYLDLYYCRLAHAKPLAFVILLLWISTLFNTIGIAASDFFCVNLSTIATALGMSETMAGVTLLAFGNGSPDLFSTFAAMSTHSSSLAIGELIGAAGFITAVVAASMALVRPFRVAKKTFIRDLLFFIVAAAFSMGFLIDGKLHLWECLFMVSFYLFYVVFVLIWHWYLAKRHKRHLKESLARGHFGLDGGHDSIGPDSYTGHDFQNAAHQASGPVSPFREDPDDAEQQQPEQDSDEDQEEIDANEQWLSEFSNNMHLTRPGRHRQGRATPIRPSLVGALEFRAVLSTLHGSRNTFWPRSYTDHPTRRRRDTLQAVSNERPVHPRADTDTALVATVPHPRVSRARAHSTNDVAKIPTPLTLLVDIAEERRVSSELSNMRDNDDSRDANDGVLRDTSPVIGHGGQFFHDTSAQVTSSAHMVCSPLADEPNSLRQTPTWWPTSLLPSPTSLMTTLFPTLCNWDEKNWTSRLIGLVGMPSILLLTVTLPVVYPESNETDKMYESQSHANSTTALLEHSSSPSVTENTAAPTQSSEDAAWARWLAIVQLFLAPLMLVFVIYTQYITTAPDRFWPALVRPSLISLLVSLILLVPILLTTSPDRRPKACQPILSLAGFVMSIAWISTIASQVVALLKTFALVLRMSHAIMGLTFFAVGNSLSDLVANITVARLGYPVMALSACFGGPMLNILLGIGLSGSWILIRGAERRHSRHPDKEVRYRTYEIDVGRTLIVSGLTLLVGLIGLLIVVPLNKWMMDKQIAIALMALWSIGTVINVGLELGRTSVSAY